MASLADRAERGVLAVHKKLEDAINTERYYEAHQIYRTLYFRYIKSKKYIELLELLLSGAKLMLAKDQQVSGADLALLVVEVLNKSGTSPDDQWIACLTKLFKSMKPTLPERDKFLATVTLWSMNGRNLGHPEWHKAIAEAFWSEKDYANAHQHFRLCEDAPLYASRLVELQQQYQQRDVDLLISKVTLQFLVARNYAMAESVYYEYVSQHPILKTMSGPPFDHYPLLNFVFYLLEAIHSGNAEQFIRLRGTYETEIARDPDFNRYLNSISSLLSIPDGKQQTSPALLFSGFLRSLMDTDADSSDEDRPMSITAASASSLNNARIPTAPEVPELD